MPITEDDEIKIDIILTSLLFILKTRKSFHESTVGYNIAGIAMVKPIMLVVVGMKVRLRKLHACGGDEWTVVRTGADVGAICVRCGRRVLLERLDFERRVKEVLARPDPSNTIAEDTI